MSGMNRSTRSSSATAVRSSADTPHRSAPAMPRDATAMDKSARDSAPTRNHRPRMALRTSRPATMVTMIGKMPWLTPKAILEAGPMPKNRMNSGRIVTCGVP